MRLKADSLSQRLCVLRRLVITLIVLRLCVSKQAFATEADDSSQPNIVFILADDLSWSDLRCYGNSIHDTPNLDRLAREGVRFTQAYAPAPICSASRAAILTGKTPARLNFEFVTKNEPGGQTLDVPLQSPPFTLDLPLAEVTLGEALARGGYHTGFFGKWHLNRHHRGYLGWSPTHSPLQQGFAEGHSDFGSHPYAYRVDKALKTQPVADGEYPNDTLIDRAVDFIGRQREERFFLYLSQYFVHDPVHSRCEWLIRKYRDRLPADALEIRASYGAMVETLDHLVGRVLTTLDETGLTENTLVVLMSDNGGHPNYTTNAPLRGSKWNLYEGGIRVPLLARWPGRTPAGAECRIPVHGCDLLPTFCAASNAELPATGLDGISLLPLLKDPTAKLERTQPLAWHFPYYHPEKKFETSPAEIGVGDFVTSQTRPHSAIRSGDWKLLHFYEDDRVELFNLRTDLAEQHNVAASEPAIAARLRSQLADYLTEVSARLPASPAR